MFVSRFIVPSLRTTTRSFSTATTPRIPLASRPAAHTFSRASFRPSQIPWRTTYHHAQARQYARRLYNYQRFQQTSGRFRRWAARPTFYYEVGGIGILCGAFYVANLEEVPVSHRRRFNIVSPEWERYFGDTQYQSTLQEFGRKIMPQQSREHQMVQRVLDRLIPHSGLEGDEWEIHVINDDMKNAFVIPGGKVFVFRGILDVCQGDDGLAAVLGHEIAHNVSRHMAERMSQYGLLLLPLGLGIMVGLDPYLVQWITSLAFTLPGSRKQEEEADYIGLLMMSESCYNPEAAVGLWSRMEKGEQGAPPQFLSTHPSSHNRLEKIRTWLPQAEEKRESSECGTVSGYVDDFQRQFKVSWS